MSRDLRVCLLFIHALITTLVFILGRQEGKGGRGERVREEGKVGRWVCGHAPKRETWEEGGNSGEINGTWLTSRWCTPGEKFALFVYGREKNERKEDRPGSFISMFREPRYRVYTRLLRETLAAPKKHL